MSSAQSHADLDDVLHGCHENNPGLLAEVLTAPPALIPQRLSAFLAPLIPHSALVFLVADAAGGPV